jgi:hypothetical protein
MQNLDPVLDSKSARFNPRDRILENKEVLENGHKSLDGVVHLEKKEKDHSAKEVQKSYVG